MNLENTIRTRTSKYYSIFLRYLVILLICYILSTFLYKSRIWENHLGLLHTAFELICVFISISSFLIVFLTYHLNNIPMRIVGFGFLAVAIYDICHIYNFPALNLYPRDFYDLSARYWLVGRFSEAFILTLGLSGIIKKYINKWIAFFITISISFGTCFVIWHYSNTIEFYSSSGVSAIKILCEYIIIVFFTLSLYLLHNKIDRKEVFAYSYIYTAVLFAISAEFCFTFLRTLDSFPSILGHILKIGFYLNIFIGVFVSTIVYPYEKIEKSQIELNQILDGLPLGIITFDTENKINFSNTKALELFECNSDDIYGLNTAEIPSQFEDLSNDKGGAYNLSISKSPNLIYTGINEYKTLKRKTINLNTDIFKYENGLLASFTATKNEQELANLRIQTRTILESINNCIIIIDSHYKILTANQAVLKTIEMDEDDIVGMHIDKLKELLQFSIEKPMSVIDKENPNGTDPLEAYFITDTGEKKEIFIHHSPIKNIDNEIIGYIIVISDITSLKEQQRKIHHQDKLALIGQMGSGIVHETKNYLASIKGYCQLLSMKMDDDVLKRYVDRIQSISDEVNRVIVGFLSMAKPSESVMDIVSLNEIIDSMRFILESPSFMKGIKIDICLCDTECTICADESQIKQVILNLTKNAIEAMEEVSNPCLFIRTQFNDKDSEMCIIISDNGIGIREEDLQKLGTPFFTTKEAGTGLGISVCYRIIKEHSGRIEVKSKAGEGTTFSIFFPCYGYSSDCTAIEEWDD